MSGTIMMMDDDDDVIIHDDMDDVILTAYSNRLSGMSMSDSDDGDEDLFSVDALQRTAIARLLDLDDPHLNDIMLDHLLQTDALEELLSYVTRLNPDEDPNGPIRPRNFSDQVALKRSFNVMELIADQRSKASQRLVQERHKQILTTLFSVFHSNSDGNFHHFRRIFESILRQKPSEVLELVCAADASPEGPLIFRFLKYLDESPVSSCLGTLLFLPVQRQDRRPFYKFLIDQKFFKKIIDAICTPDESAAFAIGDFFTRVIDECSRAETSDLIVQHVGTLNDSIMDWVFDAAMLNKPFMGNAQRTAVLKVGLALLWKSAPREYEITIPTDSGGAATQRLPNHLYPAHEYLRKTVLDRAAQLRELLTSAELLGPQPPPLRLSAYEIRQRFPTLRLVVLEIIYESLKEVEVDEVEDVLEELDAVMWPLLTNWFFEFKYNNVYHALFFKVFSTFLKFNHVPTLKAMLTKTKFLSRMIEHYLDEKTPSGCRGYIMLLCNVLRLTADSQPLSDYIPSMLQSHHQWNEFLPRLKHDTLAQIEFNRSLADTAFTPPPPHVSPIQVMPDSAEAPLVNNYFKADTIELGSQYAYSLGFIGSRRDEEVPFDSDVESPSKKKKKKKKKKKTKSRHSNGTPSSSSDDDYPASPHSPGTPFPGSGTGGSFLSEPMSPSPQTATGGSQVLAEGVTISSALPQPIKYVPPPQYDSTA